MFNYYLNEIKNIYVLNLNNNDQCWDIFLRNKNEKKRDFSQNKTRKNKVFQKKNEKNRDFFLNL